MATKYICDRCGAEIQARSLITNFAVFKVLFGKLEDINKEYELCPDCDKKLREFLSGKED